MSRIWGTALIVGGVAFVTAGLLAFLGEAASIPISWLLIVLPTINWWVFGLLAGLMAHRESPAILAHNVQASALTAIGSTALALIAAFSLVPNHLPKNVALGLLLVGLILLSLRQPLFLYEFYRGRFGDPK